ncbi:Na(+)/H(+) antiporter subunit C [Nesterenkonia sp. NBAIMH1]|uniref:Na(+)/H(+) antiporter subunit C n=1 Tax=Nesterenkonia sp. NBAIMH1 TaxID=2600320 RepID=UPI0011B70832|nr:Na(+)/H(+) antiporter subunit C [Nesterenkonia sp. NBAIMH1]
MTINLTLLIVMGAMFAIGLYLMLERSLTRVLLGIILMSNGANLLVLMTAGRAGRAPLYEEGVDAGEYLDPLPQALLLTAIVIGFATVAFMLALIYRSWVLARQDELTDDEEDRRVAAAVGAYDPEEDAEVVSETSEFAEHEDPNTGSVRPVSREARDTPEAAEFGPEKATPDVRSEGDRRRRADRLRRRGER